MSSLHVLGRLVSDLATRRNLGPCRYSKKIVGIYNSNDVSVPLAKSGIPSELRKNVMKFCDDNISSFEMGVTLEGCAGARFSCGTVRKD